MIRALAQEPALARARAPALAWLLVSWAGSAAAAAEMAPARAVLQPCHIAGVASPVRCGHVQRPLDPARPQGPQIDLHFAVLPALARHPAADPVFFLAGGPGQSAIGLAAAFQGRFARLGQRRDLVLVDQRGTGRSAPLRCEDDGGGDGGRERGAERARAARARPLADLVDPAARLARLRACRQSLQALPHGDLRFYTTDHAVPDLDAVRQALGADRINLVGLSYGSRVALAYLRLHPGQVRRAVLDGVVPPDLRLPDAAARDQQAVLDALFQACADAPECRRRHADPAGQLQALLARLPLRVSLPHPLSAQPETVTLDRDTVLGLLRAPLYQPALAAALPAVLDEAAAGRWAPLLALANPLGGSAATAIASGQHHAVVCNEDLGPGAPAGPADAAPAAGVFGDSLRRLYHQACDGWPRAAVAPGFYTVPVSPVPVWLLSGGLDPVTPPRHAQRLAQALGPLARHTVVPGAGHGVTAIACLADAVSRFIASDLLLEGPPAGADCAQGVPRPPAWRPPAGGPAP